MTEADDVGLPPGGAINPGGDSGREEVIIRLSVKMLCVLTDDRKENMAIKIDDYKKFWNEVVLPDFGASRPSKMTFAFHLANSLYHMADWLCWPNKPCIDANFVFKDRSGASQKVSDEKRFANALRDLHPDFELIRAIANSGKHLQLTNN